MPCKLVQVLNRRKALVRPRGHGHDEAVDLDNVYRWHSRDAEAGIYDDAPVPDSLSPVVNGNGRHEPASDNFGLNVSIDRAIEVAAERVANGEAIRAAEPAELSTGDQQPVDKSGRWVLILSRSQRKFARRMASSETVRTEDSRWTDDLALAHRYEPHSTGSAIALGRFKARYPAFADAEIVTEEEAMEFLTAPTPPPTPAPSPEPTPVPAASPVNFGDLQRLLDEARVANEDLKAAQEIVKQAEAKRAEATAKLRQVKVEIDRLIGGVE